MPFSLFFVRRHDYNCFPMLLMAVYSYAAVRVSSRALSNPDVLVPFIFSLHSSREKMGRWFLTFSIPPYSNLSLSASSNIICFYASFVRALKISTIRALVALVRTHTLRTWQAGR